MGISLEAIGLLADTATAIQRFVSVFVGVYVLLIFAYIILSWIRPPASLLPVVRFLDETTGPYLRLFRRFIPPLGPIDLSPIIAVISLFILERVINALVAGIL